MLRRHLTSNMFHPHLYFEPPKLARSKLFATVCGKTNYTPQECTLLKTCPDALNPKSLQYTLIRSNSLTQTIFTLLEMLDMINSDTVALISHIYVDCCFPALCLAPAPETVMHFQRIPLVGFLPSTSWVGDAHSL